LECGQNKVGMNKFEKKDIEKVTEPCRICIWKAAEEGLPQLPLSLFQTHQVFFRKNGICNEKKLK